MDIISLTLFIVLYALLLALLGMSPVHANLNENQKKRLLNNKMSAPKLETMRDLYFKPVMGLRLLLMAVMLFFMTMILIKEFNFVVAFLLFLFCAFTQFYLAGSASVQRLSNFVYSKLEHYVFKLFEKYPKADIVMSRLPLPNQKPQRIYSKEEMLYIATTSKGVLSPRELKRIQKSLAFSDITVEAIMTPRSVVEVVKSDDLLGPLKLDELHRTGYSRFPVIGEDIDDVVGVVYIRNLLELVDKQSKKARDIMDAPAHYIKNTQTLDQALAAFLKTRHHLFMVVNEFRETVGIITLEDVIEQLIGERILDQFDKHDNLRSVAARSLRNSNTPDKSKDN